MTYYRNISKENYSYFKGERDMKTKDESLVDELFVVKRKMVGVFKLKETAIIPTRATEKSACYDLYACLDVFDEVVCYTDFNSKIYLNVTDGKLEVLPHHRCLIPTGCKFLIPEGYSLRIHPRSGLSLKNGIRLSNCEGIIDQDYTDPTFILISNDSEKPFVVRHGDRLAQMEIFEVTEIEFKEVADFGAFTDRSGGLGSTGVGSTS